MMPRNAFNIADWSLGEAAGVMVLTPRFNNAMMRLVFGTGVCALLVFGVLGLDHEISRMRNNRRYSESELASLYEVPNQEIKRLTAAGRTEEARAMQKETEQFITETAEKRNAEIDAGEASDRIWHLLLRGLAGIGVFIGIYLPLSPLWQRVRIAREGDELVVRKNILPKTRRVALSAVQHAEVVPVVQHSSENGPTYAISAYWKMILNDGKRDLELYLGMAPQVDDRTLPPRVLAFLEAMQRLTR